ncbi:MAG: zinc ribbon domain-containing protein [Ignavibacteriaceae bacterium]|jgi:DNA-directed RNA polymerase subunit RPC12/RpoP
MERYINQRYKYCPYCGNSIIYKEVKYCTNCGKNVESLIDGRKIELTSNTESILNEDNQTKKLYSRGAVYAGIFFGGPLVAGILISKNFKILENEKASKYALVLGILGTILFCLLLLMILKGIIHESNQYYLITQIIFLLITTILFDISQKTEVQELLNHGAQKESGWKVLGFILLNESIYIPLLLRLPFFLEMNEVD